MSQSSPDSLTVVLNPAVVAFVQREAAAQGGIDPSQYVNELLLAAEKTRAKEILEKLLIEGLESGDPIPVNAEYWKKLDTEVAEIVAANKQSNTSS